METFAHRMLHFRRCTKNSNHFSLYCWKMKNEEWQQLLWTWVMSTDALEIPWQHFSLRSLSRLLFLHSNVTFLSIDSNVERRNNQHTLPTVINNIKLMNLPNARGRHVHCATKKLPMEAQTLEQLRVVIVWKIWFEDARAHAISRTSTDEYLNEKNTFLIQNNVACLN